MKKTQNESEETERVGKVFFAKQPAGEKRVWSAVLSRERLKESALRTAKEGVSERDGEADSGVREV